MRSIAFFIMLVSITQVSSASDYDIWSAQNHRIFKDPNDACEYMYKVIWPHLSDRYRPELNFQGLDPQMFYCGYKGNGSRRSFGTSIGSKSNCLNGEKLDYLTRKCTPKDDQKNLGDSCPKAGNPITITSGNKYQVLRIFSLQNYNFNLFYNSKGGGWSHSLSWNITEISGGYQLTRNDGKLINYLDNNGVYRSDIPSYDDLQVLSSGFSYHDESYIYHFNESGSLTSVSNVYNPYFSIKVGADKAVIADSDSVAAIVNFNQDGKIETIEYDSHVYRFSYHRNGMIHQVLLGEDQIARYEYEYSYLTEYYGADNQLITKWTYDDEWRAVSSEHADGKGKVTLAFNEDGTVTETNSLGRQTTYTFQDFDGLKRLVTVEGARSENCQAANKSYSYYSNGMLKSKTDWEGNVTSYEYNERGLEAKRIEADGTGATRVIISQWHPSLRIPVKVTTPENVTEFSYDSEGRLLNKKTISVEGL